MLGKDFYFQLIRKYIVTFGKLFDNINITRTDASNNAVTIVRVPLTYANKDKFLTRVNQDPTITQQAAIVLPRMSFELGGLKYDGQRKLNTVGRIAVPSDSPNTMKTIFNPVAYDINFLLYVYVKNAEDGTKIIEQILPFFTPDFTPTVHLIPEMDITMDIPVILNGAVNITDNYDGSFIDRRVMIWQLDFTMRAWLYGPVREKPIIKFVKTELFVDSQMQSEPVVTVTVQPGLDADGNPTSILENSVDVNTIWATDDYGFVEKVEE